MTTCLPQLHPIRIADQPAHFFTAFCADPGAGEWSGDLAAALGVEDQDVRFEAVVWEGLVFGPQLLFHHHQMPPEVITPHVEHWRASANQD